MNACNGYNSTGVSAPLTLNVVSRRFSDEVEEDGCGRVSASPSSPSASPAALSFLSAPPAASAAAAATAAVKGVREEAMTAIAKAFKAGEKTQEVTEKAEEEREREKAKADRRARDLAAVRSLTAQISDMLARQRIGDGNESEPADNDDEHSAAVTVPESGSAAGPAAAASEPRRQQQDKKGSEDEWANASLAFIVDDYQRERRRDHDSYSKVLGATSRRRRARARKSPSARTGASAPELHGKADALLLPSPTPKIEGGKSANASNRMVPIPGGASGTRCNASHALSA